MATRLLFLPLLALPLAAQVSTATATIDATGVGCQSGALLTGNVAASADLTVQYDAASAQLRLTVANTTPVVAGQATGVVNRIFLNLPPGAVTSATLVSQTGSGGATPSFQLAFDADSGSGPGNLHVACLGNFNIALTSSAQNGITNPNATIVAVPNPVVGPATFVLQLDGPGVHGISAGAILASYSQHAPAHSTNVGVKFQAAGVGGQQSGFLGGGGDCRTGVYMVGSPNLGNTVDVCITGDVGCHVCLWVSATAGPVQIGPFTIPIGLPVLGVFELGDFGLNGLGNEVCVSIPIPNVPSLVGYSLYFTNLSFSMLEPGPLSFSPAFTLTVQP